MGKASSSTLCGKCGTGVTLPEGLIESSKLPQPIFTPATKADEGHDENISFDQAAEIVGYETASFVRDLSLRLYEWAATYAATRGIILADTKFEFGRLPDGSIILIDEALTPDSSRYWLAEEYDIGYDLFDTIMHAREIQAENLANFLIEQKSNSDMPIVIHGKAYKPDVPYCIGSYSTLIGHYLEQQCQEFYYVDPLADNAERVIESLGRAYPVEIRHRARDLRDPRDLPEAMASAIREALTSHPGDVLAFLPGWGEIRRTAERLGGLNALVLPLHGELPPAEQDRALNPAPDGQRKVVLATSIAETSLTVPGVRIVVDGGYRRAPRLALRGRRPRHQHRCRQVHRCTRRAPARHPRHVGAPHHDDAEIGRAHV